ncbi:hypothetical protein [Caballeronia sp. LZ032]|uniref:DUF7946 domain-containing protein n=1 Tax=Caballeronia sp. LZ032 TaxID=3038565 RepID=UPI002855098F|nr:hypothetical protein [Caballeronia sp. LZ032]MDR5879508.1 hypothetical protein [Caballeronia sp. LZ032]
MLDVTRGNIENKLCILSVRYQGYDAIAHEIDLNQLGESIQGFARVISLCASVLATGRLPFHFDALDVSVVSLPVDEHHCFEVLAMVKSMATSKELWSGAFGAVLAAVIQYVLSRRDQGNMKYLNEALQRSMQSNELNMTRLATTVDKMMASIDKLTDILQPAARQALSPIERSCERIDLHLDGACFMSLNRTHKRTFAHAGRKLSEHLETYVGVISQFDMTTGACRVTLEGGSARLPAIVVDPAFNRPKNRYVEAMASRHSICFLAKADLDDEGHPLRLYISDTSAQERRFTVV